MNMHQYANNNFQHISEDFLDIIDKKYFNDTYGFPSIPVVCRQAFQSWEIKQKWTLDYVSKIFEESKCYVTKFNNEYEEKLEVTFQEYINLINSEPEKYSFFTKGIKHSYLKEEYVIPDYFKCWYQSSLEEQEVDFSELNFGAKATHLDTHINTFNSSSWHYLIKGSKIWFIYPNIYFKHLDTNLSEYTLASIISSSNTVKPMYCIQRPGDLIFLPGSYYHAIYNLEESISLKENFINQTNYELIKKHFKSNYDRTSNDLMNKILFDAFQTL